MRAVVYTRYGPPDVLRIVEMGKPVPEDDEVLIRVRATTVTTGDVRMRSFTVPRAQWLLSRLYLGVLKPRRAILGMELSGEIEAIGKGVSQFKVGDPVFASTFEVGFGGYADYKCMPADGLLALKPATLSFEEAAAVVGGGVTAMRCLRTGRIEPAQKVLIYGASGAVGSSAVQLASRHLGADVTAVCSTANVAWVEALGADRVIDYTRHDFTADGPLYDVVFDAVAKFPASRAKRAVKANGRYLNVHRDSHGGRGRDLLHDLLELAALVEADKLRPFIDRCYPLEQIVEAHRYVGLGHKKGNVVITLAHD